MKNRKNNPISFGITLTSGRQTGGKNSDRGRKISTGSRENALPETAEQVPIHEFDCPRRKLPQPNKPFTPDMFTCESVPMPAFPPPEKMSEKEERVRKELERSRLRAASPRLRARTVWYPASKKTSPMVLSVPWEFFKIVCIGVFIALKYAFIAVAVIITIGCMMCAGRHTGGLK